MTRRTAKIELRVAPAEKFAIEEKAAAAGLTVSEYVRYKTLGPKVSKTGTSAGNASGRGSSEDPDRPERRRSKAEVAGSNPAPGSAQPDIERRAKQLHYSKGMTMSLARKVAVQEAERRQAEAWGAGRG